MTKYFAIILMLSIVQIGCGGMSEHTASSQAGMESEVKKPPLSPKQSYPTGDEVTVTISALVSEKGSVKRVAVYESSGYPRFDAAAIRAVQKRHFEPAKRYGKTVETWVLVPIKFKLKN